MTLTPERLRALTHYDPETGRFVWRKTKGAAGAGKPVGGTHRVKGYGEAMVDGQGYATHRLAWFYVYGTWPVGVLDHINGDREDNRIANLRDVTQAENTQNQRRASRKKGPDGLLGAHYNKASGKWIAAICVNYRQIYLGAYATADEAHSSYLAAKRKLHAGCTI